MVSEMLLWASWSYDTSHYTNKHLALQGYGGRRQEAQPWSKHFPDWRRPEPQQPSGCSERKSAFPLAGSSQCSGKCLKYLIFQ